MTLHDFRNDPEFRQKLHELIKNKLVLKALDLTRESIGISFYHEGVQKHPMVMVELFLDKGYPARWDGDPQPVRFYAMCCDRDIAAFRCWFFTKYHALAGYDPDEAGPCLSDDAPAPCENTTLAHWADRTGLRDSAVSFGWSVHDAAGKGVINVGRVEGEWDCEAFCLVGEAA